jgi:hypothetical protein
LAAWHRVYFAAVGSFALWVGLWGYFFPDEIARAIPWQVPPLHARFIGSMYLSGMVMMAGGLLTEGRSDTRVALAMAAIWTGMLLLVSLLHLGEFDYSRVPVWFWFGAYIVYPIAGAWLAWLYQPRHVAPPGVGDVPAAAKAWLTAQGVVCIALAVALFFAPTLMGSIWPWKIPVLLTQIYSGPFLSYGIGSLLLARLERWADLRIALISMLTFALLVLAASIIHRATFGEIGTAATIWFAGFGLASLVLAWLSFRAVSEGGR